VLNEKLTAELSDKTALASKLTEQLQCSQTELNQLKTELAKVSRPVFSFVKWFALCCRMVVCLCVCLIILLYCGTEVGLGPGDIVLDRTQLPLT